MDQTATRTVRIVIDAAPARQGGSEAERALKGIQAASDQVAGAVSRATSALAAFAAIGGLVATVKAFAEGIATAGLEVRNLIAQLNFATGAAEGSKLAFEAVVDVAKRTGAGLSEVGGAFQRIALGARDIGATTDQVARVTETFIKLGRIGGASVEDINGALVQFGQSMASGRVQGDEFRSLMERVPAVMRAIAQQLDVNVGRLREMSTEGELTANKAFGALIKASATADSEFQKLPVTLEQAGNRAATSWKLFGAALDEATGISGFLARALDATADRVATLAKRIGGDLAQSLVDIRTQIEALERKRAELAGVRSKDMPSMPADIVPPVELPGDALRRQVQIRSADQQLGALRDLQLQRSQQASSKAEFEMWERDAEARSAAARAAEAQAEALKKLNEEVLKIVGSYDKGVSAAEKAREAEKKLNEAVSGGLYTRAQADEILKKYRAQLDGTASAAESAASKEATARAAAQKALDDYLTGLRNEASASQLTERERAVMLAGLKAEELARAKVLGLTEDQIRARTNEARASAGTNYDADQARRLLEQQAKRESELLLEPFKHAISGIQSAFTDLFTNVLNGGVTKFRDLANAFKQVFVRMFAELASLNVMRALGLDRLVAGMAGGASGTAGGATAGGGLGSFNPLSFVGGIPGLGFLNQPIMPGTADPTTGATSGPGFLGGTTWGQGLSGLGMAGFGAYQLATGGGSTGSLISGIGSMAAGAMSFIPGAQAFAPIVAIGAQLLGSLFGGGKPQNPQATTDIVIENGRAVVGGNTSRGAGNTTGTNQAGQSVADAINRTLWGVGLRFGAGAQGGYLLNSTGQQTGEQWIFGSGSYANGSAVETASGLSGSSAMAGLIGNIIRDAAADGRVEQTGRLAVSATMMKVLSAAGEFTEDELQRRIDFAKAYDDALLGKGGGADVTRAIRNLREEFNALAFEAERLGVAVAPLDAELQSQISKMGTDFASGLADRVLQQQDPLAYQRTLNLRAYNEGVEQATALWKNGALSLDQFNESLADLGKLLGYANDNAVQSVTSGARGQIQSAIQALAFGSVSLAAPAQTFSGLQGTYQSLLSKAMAGDSSALSQVSQAGLTLADYGNRYYGGDTRAAALRSAIMSELANLSLNLTQQTLGQQVAAEIRPLMTLLVQMIDALQKGTATAADVNGALLEFIDEQRHASTVVPTSSTTVIDDAA